MPGKSNNLRQFWQEIKRRRVIHVITVYASAAFVIIELIDNLTEPLNLPPSLSTVVIIILAVGFPLAIVLSWIYDLTSHGVERTKHLSEVKEEEKPSVPNAWKIATYVSFVVIIGLVTYNIIGGTKKLRAGDIKTILILPFENYTGEEKLDEFISGMHSAFISDIGRISGLEVKSKTTSDAYKDIPVSQIAAEQGVDAVIKPSIMCLADSICFQLSIETPDGEKRWMADFHEPRNQLLNLNNLITKEFAEEVHIKLTKEEERLLAESRTADEDAVEAYYRGLAKWESFELGIAMEYFKRAIQIDPGWAPPYADLSRVWTTLRFFGAVPDSIAHPHIYENLNKALELEPSSAHSLYSIAMTATWTEWDWNKGEDAFVGSLKLNPNDSKCRMYYAHLLMVLRRSDEAVIHAKLAMELDPLNPLILALGGNVMLDAGDFQSAIELIKKSLSIDPNFGFATSNLENAYLQAGDGENWLELWKARVCWNDQVVRAVENALYEDGFIPAMEELIRMNDLYGNPSCGMGPGMSFRYNLRVNNIDRALDYLEQLHEAGFTQLPYTATNVNGYEQLKSYPRYGEILRKLNLPVPEE